VPQPGDPRAWDRYSYVLGNPVRYSDPSGYKACEGLNDCNESSKTLISKDDYFNMLLNEFGWGTDNNNYWSYQEAKTIYESAYAILDYANKTVKNGNGLSWMEILLGDVYFTHQAYLGIQAHMVPEGNNMHLLPSWIDDPREAKGLLIHELGHVVDNRSSLSSMAVWSGQGMGDKLALYMGANASKLDYSIRWCNGTMGIFDENQWNKNDLYLNYGNNSTADYFAHTFSFAILAPQMAPANAVAALRTLMYEY
jgi:hypothetical protein